MTKQMPVQDNYLKTENDGITWAPFRKNIWTFCPNDQESIDQSLNNTESISCVTWETLTYGHPDLITWSAFNPIQQSITEMYGNEEVNSSEMDPDITLPNHSTDTSAFVPYRCIKKLDLVECKSFHTIVRPPLSDDGSDGEEEDPFYSELTSFRTIVRSPLSADIFGSYGEEEDLFYSELTHFIPIENYVDDSDSDSNIDSESDSTEENFVNGHTFNISNELDRVKFYRTDSGLLCYESEKYLEYNCNDVNKADNLNTKRDQVFVIKFPLKHSGEIACQTEEEDLDDSLEETDKIGCGLKYLCKLLLKKAFRCCFKKNLIK